MLKIVIQATIQAVSAFFFSFFDLFKVF